MSTLDIDLPWWHSGKMSALRTGEGVLLPALPDGVISVT